MILNSDTPAEPAADKNNVEAEGTERAETPGNSTIISLSRARALAGCLAQMTPDERAQDALDLVARARQRLAEYRQTIEHEPAPEDEK